MAETKRFKRLCSSIDYYYCLDKENDDKGLTEADMLDMLNELSDENKQIKHIIKEAYNNERTQIGKNVLKQLMEAIE